MAVINLQEVIDDLKDKNMRIANNEVPWIDNQGNSITVEIADIVAKIYVVRGSHPTGERWWKKEFTDGKINGLHRRWYTNGRLSREYNYYLGKLNDIAKEWFSNGQLELEENYSHGRQQGTSRSWYKDGQLRSEINYVQGDYEGLYRYWHPNGQLNFERIHQNGLLHGLKRSWDESGNLKSSQNYKHGFPVDEEVVCDEISKEIQSDVTKCSCDLDTIMDFGCQCGGS